MENKIHDLDNKIIISGLIFMFIWTFFNIGAWFYFITIIIHVSFYYILKENIKNKIIPRFVNSRLDTKNFIDAALKHYGFTCTAVEGKDFISFRIIAESFWLDKNNFRFTSVYTKSNLTFMDVAEPGFEYKDTIVKEIESQEHLENLIINIIEKLRIYYLKKL